MATTAKPANTTETTDPGGGVVALIELDQIQNDRNVRELAEEEVDALAGSIELLGQITPAIVRPVEDGGYMLVAGHKRYAALRKLGRSHIRAEVRSADAEHSERAAENIVRSQLNPYEEAKAVAAMLERGYTPDGAAQALGWSKARVTARVKLLQLPDAAQVMVGDGRIALAAIDHLLAVGNVSPALLDALVTYVGQESDDWTNSRLVREPAWVIGQALRAGELDGGVFAEFLGQVSSYDLRELALGKTAQALIDKAAELNKQLDRYSYGFTIEFSEQEVDQARAAGVLIEFDTERSTPIIVDRKLYRQLCRDALKRAVAELERRIVQRETDRKAHREARKQRPSTEVDPAAEADRDRRRRLAEIAEDAHGANLDLGRQLLDGFATVDPSDMTVARLFAYAALGADWHGSGYGNTGERVHQLAVHGIRYVIGEFREDVTRTRKDGSRGKLRIDYGDSHASATAEPAVKWLWRFVDGAKTAGELYGRVLVVIAAEHYATRLVVPGGQRGYRHSWSSHKDHTVNALEKLAGSYVPASLKAIERAVKKAQADHDRAVAAAKAQPDKVDRGEQPDEPVGEDRDPQPESDPDSDELAELDDDAEF